MQLCILICKLNDTPQNNINKMYMMNTLMDEVFPPLLWADNNFWKWGKSSENHAADVARRAGQGCEWECDEKSLAMEMLSHLKTSKSQLITRKFFFSKTVAQLRLNKRKSITNNNYC